MSCRCQLCLRLKDPPADWDSDLAGALPGSTRCYQPHPSETYLCDTSKLDAKLRQLGRPYRANIRVKGVDNLQPPFLRGSGCICCCAVVANSPARTCLCIIPIHVAIVS